MQKLTHKQETFCKAIVSGKNQSDAYREAYKTDNMTDTTINEAASVVNRNYKVGTRIKELRKPIADKFNKSVQKLLQEYEELILEAKTDKDRRIVIDAMKEQGKLLGYYEDTIKHKNDPDNPLNTGITVTYVNMQERVSEVLEKDKNTPEKQ